MAVRDVTTTIDSEKYQLLKDNGIKISEVLNDAVDGYLQGFDGYYTKPVIDLHAALSEQIAARETVEARLEVYEGRLAAINTKIEKLEEELKLTEQHARESAQSSRVTQLLRDINQAIMYNDYKVPDIELVVKKQLKEIKQLQPEFSLEKQIETMKKFSS